MINVVIPMAGAGSRFQKEGYTVPKPFILINDKMMIEHVLDGVNVFNAHYTLVIQRKFLFEQKKELELLIEKYKVGLVVVDSLTQGACCTALATHEIINNNNPVVFVDSDNIFDNKKFNSFINEALEEKLDGSLLTFATSDDCYSFVRIDQAGYVIETKEKVAISNQAIAGAYFFSRGSTFVKYAIENIIYGNKTNNEFYMSNVFNYVVNAGLKIGTYNISANDWNCVGTPAQLKCYINNLSK